MLANYLIVASDRKKYSYSALENKTLSAITTLIFLPSHQYANYWNTFLTKYRINKSAEDHISLSWRMRRIKRRLIIIAISEFSFYSGGIAAEWKTWVMKQFSYEKGIGEYSAYQV